MGNHYLKKRGEWLVLLKIGKLDKIKKIGE